MIKPIDPIVRLYYNTYKPSDLKRLVEERKEVQKDLKSTCNKIDIKV